MRAQNIPVYGKLSRCPLHFPVDNGKLDSDNEKVYAKLPK